MRFVDWMLILPLFACVDSAKEILKCYQCAAEENKHCTDEYLTPCPDDQAYDRCMTRISKTKEHGFLIQKSCALAPCTFRDPKQSSGLGLDDCDRSKEEYDCVSCCKTHGCNTDDGTRLRPVMEISFGLCLTLTLLSRTLRL